MELLSDVAIILQTRLLNDKDLLLDLLTKQHGKLKMIAKFGASSKKKPIYQPLNHIFFHSKSRIAGQIGQIEAEIIKPYFALNMNNSTLMNGLQAANSLCQTFLPEREPNNIIYQYLLELYEASLDDNINNFMQHYAIFELILLQECGYGLRLNKCVATGVSDNLTYISPKSGGAVCLSAGEPFKDKLFTIPKFYFDNHAATSTDIRESLRITEYFIEKNLCALLTKKMPQARSLFLSKIFSSN
jgi:DNA repair protein RecO (recombination protein O)